MSGNSDTASVNSVGLVFARPPGYSESFLDSFVDALSAAGVEISIFVDTGNVDRHERRFVAPCIERAHPLLSSLRALVQITILVLVRPGRIRRLAARMFEEGFGLIDIVKVAAHNSHILLWARPSWLHFCFASLVIGREYVAAAVGAKMTISVRGYDVTIVPLNYCGCYSRLWPVVDRVHVISDDLHRIALAEGLPPDVTVKKIVPAVDTKFFAPTNESRIADRHYRILTVARLHWKKGIESTLEALAHLKYRCKSIDIDWRYTVIGGGADRERLVFAAHQLGIEDRVEMVGLATREEVRQHMAASDLYIQYSVQEGFCNAVLEAQAMGLVCIVSDAEGLPENIKDGERGFVVRKRQPRLLAEAIKRVVEMPEVERRRIRETARKHTVAHHGIRRQRQGIRQFFDLEQR